MSDHSVVVITETLLREEKPGARHLKDVSIPPEIIYVQAQYVACGGSGGTLGHPLVYLTFGDAPYIECGYCDRRFVYQP